LETRRRLISARLSDGTLVKIEGTPIGEQQVASTDLSFEKAVSLIESIATDLKKPLQRLAPQKATVKFGLELGLESGGLTAIIVKGTTTANLEISLEWAASAAK
jgi:hypothetical protein